MGMIWPWIEDELESVFAAIKEDGKSRITAVCVLRFWTTLRRVILQDAAAMFVLHPDRLEHPVLKLPIFRHPLFLVSRHDNDDVFFFLLLTFVFFRNM